jgi:hypothetical protein
MWVGASAPDSAAVSANAAYYLSWERRRLGGSLKKKLKRRQIPQVLFRNCCIQQAAG